MKTQKGHQKSGFTLIELLLVIAIIVIIFGISLSSLFQSQATQLFNNNFMKIVSMVNSARSQAITGKGQLDYTDFDNDGKNYLSNDFVTPANYGVFFDTTASSTPSIRVILFADINPPKSGFTGAKGKFDNTMGSYASGKDLILDSLTLPVTNLLQIVDGDSPVNMPVKSAIFYSPNYADISYESMDTSASPIIKIRLTQTTISLCRQISIHRLAGIPEIGPCI